jgi:glutathione S-transferase
MALLPGTTITQVTLVSHPICPFAQRVGIALREKGIDFESRWVDPADPPPWFAALSPTGRVPLLLLDMADGRSEMLFESLPICEYIEDIAPSPALHPSDPLARARHRAWMEQASAMLGDIWPLLTPGADDKRRESLRKKLALFEPVLGDGPFFAGDGFSLVDTVAAPAFRYFPALDEALVQSLLSGLPRVSRWRAALSERESVRRAVPDDFYDRLAAFIGR